jgi:hypothetical protein
VNFRALTSCRVATAKAADYFAQAPLNAHLVLLNPLLITPNRVDPKREGLALGDGL